MASTLLDTFGITNVPVLLIILGLHSSLDGQKLFGNDEAITLVGFSIGSYVLRHGTSFLILERDWIVVVVFFLLIHFYFSSETQIFSF